MERMLGVGAIVSIVALLLIGLVLPISPESECSGGLFAFQSRLEQEAERCVRLQAELEEGERLRVERTALVDSFRHGRIELAEVFTAFRALNEHRPILMSVLRLGRPGYSEEQYLGFQILTVVHGMNLDCAEREMFACDVICQLGVRFGGDVLVPDQLAHLVTNSDM
jgi:hypothetical protein